MKIEFLGQGYQSEWDRPVGNYLIQFLESGLFHTFTALSAFASVGGVLALGKSVQQARDSSVQINIIVGVDQKGTSKEALEALMALGVHTFVFTQREHPIFHPKLYLFEGENNSALIIGSSNLTLKGLWQNVEASILIEIEHQDEAGIVEEIKTYFSGLFDFTDPNLMPLNGAVIEQLVQLKKVPTEAERKRLHDEKKKIKVDAEEADSIREILENLIPGRAVNKLPQVFFDAVKSARSSPIGEELPAKQQVVAVPEDRGVLVWRRKKLPASSVQMAGTGTNPTGGLRLVQDHFEVNGQVIDQTTYFRELFSSYNWTALPGTPFREVAKVPFHVTILDEYLGEFELEVRHKPSGEAGQGNYTTSISWGALSETVRNANLVDSELTMYAPVDGDSSFYIEIN